MDPNAQPPVEPAIEQPLVTPPAPSLPPAETPTGINAPFSTLAIVGFILDFFVAPLGLVLSIVALVKIKKNGQRGRGLATAGVVVGTIFTLFFVPILVIFTVIGAQVAAKTSEALVVSNEYVTAVAADDGAAAYALESSDVQAQDTADELTTGFQSLKLSGTRSVIGRSYHSGDTPTATITYKYSSGSPKYVVVSLIQNGGQWQVEGLDPTDTEPTTTTPSDSLSTD